MRWKMNILFFWTLLMSVYSQEVLIVENLDTSANKSNVSVSVNGDNYRNEEVSAEEPKTSESDSSESHSQENAIEDNVIPDHETSEGENQDQIASNEDQIASYEDQIASKEDQIENDSPDVAEVPPVPENTMTSSEEAQQTTEGHQSQETPSTTEDPPVANSSEQVVSSVQELSEERDIEYFVVTTTHGPVQGHQWNESPDIISYIDVPYGRISSVFQAPEKPDTWEETHHAELHSVRCPQAKVNEETRTTEMTGQIDCLTLSVFVPAAAENADVLFHIHDGGFNTGSGDPLLYGPEYLLSRGIILVLPNYRLGPLGFLCLQNETAPGNAALKDLTLALNWTYANIAAFGGNPDNIVVSGDGRSGALAGYLALSPTSKDYVSKIITESGPVISHWAIDRDPITTATILSERIRKIYAEYTFNDSLFHDIDTEKLILGSQEVYLRPCVEQGSDSFITETPWYILQDQKINTSFMIGSASFAGLHEALSHDEDSISQLNEDFGYFMPDDLHFKNGREEMVEVANEVKTQYFGESSISLNSDELALVYTDASYLSPAIRAARVLAEAGATVYFYEFAFVGALNREHIALGSEVNGSVRGDIVGYLFTQGGQVPEEGSNEEKMVNLMTDLWTSFIHNGTPISSGVEWNQLESTSEDEEEWLWIGSETQARKGFHLDRLQLWTKIYDQHFVERNVAKVVSRNPALVVIAISVLGLFPKSMQVSR